MNFFNKFLVISLVTGALSANAQELIISNVADLQISPSAVLVLNNGMSLVNNSLNDTLNGTIIFRGTLPQKIAGNQPVTIATLNIENGTFVSLANDVVVSSNLNLTSGIINLLDNNLRISSGTSITGTFSGTSMIVAEGNGTLQIELSGNGEYLLPLGDTSGVDEYSPAKLTFSSGTYTNAVVSANLKNSKHPNNSSTTDYLKRYWAISQTGIADFSCDVSFTYTNNDITGTESSMYGAKWNGSYWMPLNQLTLNEITGNVDGFSDFTGGEHAVLSVNEATDDVLEVLVDGNTIIMKSDNRFPVKQIELFNKLGQRIYSKMPGNALYNELSINEKSDIYLLRLSSTNKTITKKIYIR